MSATARVTVMVEVACGQWSAGCTIEQVRKQAGREAAERVSRVLHAQRGMKVVGEPSIDVILIKESK